MKALQLDKNESFFSLYHNLRLSSWVSFFVISNAAHLLIQFSKKSGIVIYFVFRVRFNICGGDQAVVRVLVSLASFQVWSMFAVIHTRIHPDQKLSLLL